ncbi:hypothetical protein [Dyella lutea]|uniref:P-type conjugative transfer protein TrbJ n=1 Tax=Dyella lutea TaxID=2950441 RepID=A0ABT1F6P3_9GAMM|nr:hypothetical protein [Dyella lutea]MCP1373039.1 hypothetical protein [Dyella lutea]
MNEKSNGTRALTGAISRALITASVIMFAGSASAQWIVHDPGNAVINESGFASQLAKTIEQYAMQAQQYATQLQQYQNMLTSIESLGTGISLFPKTMQRMSDAQIQKLVEQACPGPSLGTGVIGAITSTLEYEASFNKPITESQQVICQQIVMLQADEYNVTVDAMGQLAVQASTVQKLSKVVNSISSMGKAASATSQTEQYLSQLQTAAETWQKQIEADEAVIQTLKRQQGILAKVALTGSNTVLGNVVQAAALKAAFTIND